MKLSRKRLQRSLQGSWHCHFYAQPGGTANKLLLTFCFNLADAFSLNYESNTPFHWFNKCVDTDIPDPPFPGQDHVSLETHWACRPPSLFSHKQSGLKNFSGRTRVGWGAWYYTPPRVLYRPTFSSEMWLRSCPLESSISAGPVRIDANWMWLIKWIHVRQVSVLPRVTEIRWHQQITITGCLRRECLQLFCFVLSNI